ncbi:hypothetical protein OB2597_08199 [Pseudooceanicola batsensis HTCC2597]|uniref:Uncharacterized protein n=1 Tax=Pseudooceanicola batsensis (strain ATCC BAA-863 / DSM 15984 / KCTC 12145 / HTCC2597) TaxID=252305 RepID=A3TUB2_PSEBH|nr:hypothetical protein OB2597_08199 [Pseudooceanicola batsensis HTCC2597]
MLSSAFFIFFGLSFLLVSLGFWQLGRTDGFVADEITR